MMGKTHILAKTKPIKLRDKEKINKAQKKQRFPDEKEIKVIKGRMIGGAVKVEIGLVSLLNAVEDITGCP